VEEISPQIQPLTGILQPEIRELGTRRRTLARGCVPESDTKCKGPSPPEIAGERADDTCLWNKTERKIEEEVDEESLVFIPLI
jgi:hypothetical protein